MKGETRRRWLTLLVAEVRVEALGLEHDEERAPSQQHSGEEQILNDGGHCHPPAPGERRGQGGSHGRGGTEVGETCRVEQKETADSKLEARTHREWAPLADAQDEGSLICRDKRHREGLQLAYREVTQDQQGFLSSQDIYNNLWTCLS